jgi:hypothetical protein
MERVGSGRGATPAFFLARLSMSIGVLVARRPICRPASNRLPIGDFAAPAVDGDITTGLWSTSIRSVGGFSGAVREGCRIGHL